jgi:hypothetical protein
MPSRREFLQAGLAASIVPVAMPIHASSGDASRSSTVMPAVHALYTVVCDVRSIDSAALAVEMQRAGVSVTRIAGDITDFWFTDLSLRWREAPVAVAGLTAHGPLFCLERLAWDHGMRVVFRGTHRLLHSGRLEHSIAGPAGTIAAAQSAGLEGSQWARGVARLLNSCETARESSSITMAGATPTNGRLDETLVSWVVAPRSQR